jgi:hypothetical protein
MTEIYCVYGCGRPAVLKMPLGVTGTGDLITEWVCSPQCPKREDEE